ncbi:hypothetical protein [Streptomyces pseudogriseolus]|uniref:hypothetical protein n=1 Tax=Streptomyces pseudogriseolus TaxID=36817 RepID=UPI003FA29FFA
MAWRQPRRSRDRGRTGDVEHLAVAGDGQCGIPLCLLIDRDACTVTVRGGPDRQIGGYRDARTAKFGEKVLLPEPMGIELDTEILENYVR